MIVAFFVFIIQQANYYQGELAPILNRDLGFNHDSPYVSVVDNRYEEVFRLDPWAGKIFAKAGVKERDIGRDYSITGLYRALHKHRGEEFTFRVTDGGDGIPIKDRVIRSITIRIPLLNERDK